MSITRSNRSRRFLFILRDVRLPAAVPGRPTRANSFRNQDPNHGRPVHLAPRWVREVRRGAGVLAARGCDGRCPR